MSLLNPKRDRYGTQLTPGDICVRAKDDKVEYIVYQKEVFGGKGSKGEFGRFRTSKGPVTIKYTSVVYVCDPMGERKYIPEEILDLTRSFYE